EIEVLLDEIKKVDANLTKRLAPLETAIGRFDEIDHTAAEQKAAIEGLTKSLAEKDRALEDMRAMVKAVRQATTDSRGSYAGIFPTREVAKQFGWFIMAAIAGRKEYFQKLEDAGIDVKAMAEGVNSTGGALVPEIFSPSLIDLMPKYGVFRRNVTVVPMGSDSQYWPKLDSDVTVYAPGENTAITASDLGFSSVGLVAKKLATLTAISSELEEDAAVAIGELVGTSIVRAFAKAEDQCGFLGDGSTTYFGFMGITGAFQSLAGYSAQTASTTMGGLVTASGNTYAEILLPSYDNMVAALPSDFDEGAAWYVHKSFFWNVMVPRAHAYSSSVPTIGAASEIYQGPRGNFIFRGYPVEFTSVMPKTEAASQICAFLGNLRAGAYLGTRGGLRIARSTDVYFASDQVGIRGTQRIAMNVFGHGSITEAGPICALITYAS
ncbi:MAG TPA: phage major capsid protein, partial [Phycisphaerae bacterium]|nr:phage major capsid protein [Phycisphaerae bacterium]